MSAYRWRYLSSPGNYPATVRAARRRLTRLDSRTVKTWVPRTRLTGTQTVRAGVHGA